MRFNNILCPVDFSDCSRDAFLRAVELAKRPAARLILVTVYQVPFYEGAPYMPDVMRSIQEGAEQALAKWSAEAKTLGAGAVEAVALLGVPWDEIVRLARERASDLIVMGTHGRRGIKHALIGSVAETVVRHAPCSVLVVRGESGI